VTWCVVRTGGGLLRLRGGGQARRVGLSGDVWQSCSIALCLVRQMHQFTLFFALMAVRARPANELYVVVQQPVEWVVAGAATATVTRVEEKTLHTCWETACWHGWHLVNRTDRLLTACGSLGVLKLPGQQYSGARSAASRCQVSSTQVPGQQHPGARSAVLRCQVSSIQVPGQQYLRCQVSSIQVPGQQYSGARSAASRCQVSSTQVPGQQHPGARSAVLRCQVSSTQVPGQQCWGGG